MGYMQEAKLGELSSNQILFTRLCIDWKGLFPLIDDFVYDEELQTRENAIAVTSVVAGGCVQVFHQCLQPLLKRRFHLIVDRYWFDDIVYRSYWVEERWVRDLYASIPVPDLAKQENMFVVDGGQDLGLKHQMILNEVHKLIA
ncbi:hypothetical protein [Paenibacillus massiliensis]|uniref:hypothetical protein n=1 Tax=Paenibacillus massiliensis TaxID=225917 RepID=UPI00037E8D21|nr:hypothetical protein [Paenibacillus massiliensis]